MPRQPPPRAYHTGRSRPENSPCAAPGVPAWRRRRGPTRVAQEAWAHPVAAAALFVSPYTINTHLRHAFTKLGVRSWVELTRLALARSP
ncbi:MAG: LuxR C-terminal-related transcriptional regulator [Kitasatospora sp.]|nr:LuxR C-terminal-related transcriptional regulator [Kitasatospora sp.]